MKLKLQALKNSITIEENKNFWIKEKTKKKMFQTRKQININVENTKITKQFPIEIQNSYQN